MRRAIVTFLVFAAATTTVAVAQDGSGHVDEDDIALTMPTLLPAPTPAAPAGPVQKLSQPEQR